MVGLLILATVGACSQSRPEESPFQFAVSYDPRTWWTCDVPAPAAAVDCLSVFHRRLTRLVYDSQCTDRLQYIDNSVGELHEIQYAVTQYMNSATFVVEQSNGFTPLMEVIANVALQKAAVCIVDGTALRELLRLVDQTMSPVADSQWITVNRTVVVMNVTLSANTTMAANGTLSPQQQAALDPNCRLAPELSASLRDKLHQLRKKKAAMEADLALFMSIVDGYQQLGQGQSQGQSQGLGPGQWRQQQGPFGYGQNSQPYQGGPDLQGQYSGQYPGQGQPDYTAMSQFGRLAERLRKSIAEATAKAKELTERAREMKQILSGSGCTLALTNLTSGIAQERLF